MEPDAVEMRVLGCLIEKQHTTPGAYPLTLNSLRLACNQATNRDPVVDFDETTIRGALERLGRRKWTRMASWSSGRSMKYRHMLGESLSLSEAELAVLGVLMLRGAQTPGELKQRTERMHAFAGDDLQLTLDRLAERELVGPLGRRAGQREPRYEQRLGGAEGAAEPSEPGPAPEYGPAAPEGDDRLARIESELAELREQVRALRAELGS